MAIEGGTDRSYVVTGGGRGVGRAVVERLLRDGGHVVVVELDAAALAWLPDLPRAVAMTGDAADEDIAAETTERAQELAPLAGWVNNAAVFRDASVHTASARDVLDLVERNLGPAVVGCSTAIRRFLAAGTGGAIVNVSSHQARRAVPGCTPYVTAKAAIEGLTRALAVEYGGRGVRVNAVTLGSIATERYAALLDELGPAEAARVVEEMRIVHPLGRVGRPAEVAATVAHLLSDDAGFITGARWPWTAAARCWPSTRRPTPADAVPPTPLHLRRTGARRLLRRLQRVGTVQQGAAMARRTERRAG